jgi:MoaA/NifB/PqqE/SkfB family radical SAM enzyme
MMRKVYIDLLRRKAGEGRLGWVLGAGAHYLRARLSPFAGRPLCGPILGTLVTNYSCNLGCSMCGMPRRHAAHRAEGRRELSTAEMLAVIDGFAELGTRGIGFTGGEPLLRPDLFTLLRRTRARGVLAHLNTNGTLLDDDKIDLLLDAGVESLNISLDGATAAVHDGIRGVAGAFESATGAVRRVLAARDKVRAALRVKVVAVLARENLGEVRGYLALGAELGVDCDEFIPRQAFTDGTGGPGKPVPADPALLAKVEEALAVLRDRRSLPVALEDSPRMLDLFLPAFRGEPSPLACYAGYNSLAVDCYGRIFPCVPWVNWEKPVGDLAGTTLPRFWRSPASRAWRDETAACHACTLNCQAELNLIFQPFRRL